MLLSLGLVTSITAAFFEFVDQKNLQLFKYCRHISLDLEVPQGLIFFILQHLSHFSPCMLHLPASYILLSYSGLSRGHLYTAHAPGTLVWYTLVSFALELRPFSCAHR